MGSRKPLMFCHQRGRVSYESHGDTWLLGSCLAMTSAPKGHGRWNATSISHKQHGTHAWNGLCPRCGLAKCHRLVFCLFNILPHPALRVKLAPALAWTASGGHPVTWIWAPVPSFRCNYPDCRSTMGDTGTHSGLTMEKANRDAHVSAQPWTLSPRV